MFRNFQNIFTKVRQIYSPNVEQIRNTYVLRRKKEPRLSPLGATKYKKLKKQSYYYTVVEDRGIKKQPKIDIILLKNVKGYGNTGDIIPIPQLMAYEYFILTGAATYATPENIKKYAKLKDKDAMPIEIHNILCKLAETHVPVFMSEYNPWTIQPWHVKLALRKIGIYCKDECIKLPEEEISGPNLDINKMDFPIQLTINKKYPVNMRCRLFHIQQGEGSVDLSFNPKFYLEPLRPIFPEHKEILEKIPVPSTEKVVGIVIL